MPADPPTSSGPPAAPGLLTTEAQPAAIRHAATVVVVRPGAGGREVYMVRRSAKSPFMPSTLVFPGGRLDPEDGPPEQDQSWITAARRECDEEAALPLSTNTLHWFDTWLTPSAESRRRYLARFYVAELAEGEGGQAQADGHETHEGRWATAAAHLAAWEAEDVDLPPPTVAVLQRLRDAEGHPDGLARMLAVDPSEPILPKFVPREGQPVILMPHHPDYAEAPGESAPVPARCHALPSHFVREGRRWLPC